VIFFALGHLGFASKPEINLGAGQYRPR